MVFLLMNSSGLLIRIFFEEFYDVTQRGTRPRLSRVPLRRANLSQDEQFAPAHDPASFGHEPAGSRENKTFEVQKTTDTFAQTPNLL
jgi:hypothetical protein